MEDQKQIKTINRILTWNDIHGISYEVDPRYVELIRIQLR